MMNSGKKRFTSVLVTAIGMGTVFVMIFPIIWLLMSSFKDSTELFAYPLNFFSKGIYV